MVRNCAIVTCSDRVSAGTAEDLAGPALREMLEAHDLLVVEHVVVPDERDQIAAALRGLARRGDVHLVVATGGTGFAPRDVTPEATADMIDRPAPGLAEAMRAAGRTHTAKADLSRGICGIAGDTLILNLPGSTTGATDSLAAVLPILGHALALLQPLGDGDEHGARA